jgi:hypothetical protein
MKMLLGLLALALSTASFASSVDTETFVYTGAQNSVELLLKTEKTHTEYRTEPYQTTCSRTETYYRRVCEGGGVQTICTQTPQGRVCRTHGTPMRCYDRPEYRTVWYPCTQTRTVSFEVKDYDVEARIIVDVANASQLATAGESITVKLDGETVSASATGSKQFFILSKKQDVRSAMNNGVKMLDGVVAVELVPAEKILKAVALDNISVANNIVNVNSQNLEERAATTLSLKVVRKKLLGSDPVLFDRELAAAEVAVNGNSAGIDLSKLGVDISDGKFEITAKSAVKLNGSLLNSSQFGDALSSSKTVVIKN